MNNQVSQIWLQTTLMPRYLRYNYSPPLKPRYLKYSYWAHLWQGISNTTTDLINAQVSQIQLLKL